MSIAPEESIDVGHPPTAGIKVEVLSRGTRFYPSIVTAVLKCEDTDDDLRAAVIRFDGTAERTSLTSDLSPGSGTAMIRLTALSTGTLTGECLDRRDLVGQATHKLPDPDE